MGWWSVLLTSLLFALSHLSHCWAVTVNDHSYFDRNLTIIGLKNMILSENRKTLIEFGDNQRALSGKYRSSETLLMEIENETSNHSSSTDYHTCYTSIC